MSSRDLELSLTPEEIELWVESLMGDQAAGEELGSKLLDKLPALNADRADAL